ncbi:MAG: hypothetical protein WKF77_09265 [Planctomycetaceae bacterium]
MAIQQTFDQKFNDHPDSDPVSQPDLFAPHRTLAARIVFEPMPLPDQPHVRITARTDDYNLLWGTVISESTKNKRHVEVALYDRLMTVANECFPQSAVTASQDQLTEALDLIKKLKARLEQFEGDLQPITVSDKTMKRAASRLPGLKDALKLIGVSSTEAATDVESRE